MTADVVPSLVAATPEDAPALMPMVERFYTHFGYPFDAARKRATLDELLASPARGRIFHVVDAGGERAGYLFLSFYFSLEYGGLTAFVDELWIDADRRGTGLGTRALLEAVEVARGLGITAVHLEAERTNTGAAALYQRLGFKDYDRRLLTMRLGAAS